MTPLVRWFRNLREKLFGSFFEGPAPPDRLAQMAIVFANTNPTATRAEWLRFCIEHARESYRAGWVRGYEYTERDPDERAIISQVDPDVVATAMDPDWQWSPEVTLTEEPTEVIREEQLTEREEMERLFKQALLEKNNGSQ